MICAIGTVIINCGRNDLFLPQNPSNLAGVTGVPLVEQVTDSKAFVHTFEGVHGIIDGNVSRSVVRELLLDEIAHDKAVSTKAGMVFDDDGGHVSGFHLGHQRATLSVAVISLCSL